MKNNPVLELKKANSKLENAIRMIKNSNINLKINEQKRKYVLRENELLIEQNRKSINYLTFQIKYSIFLWKRIKDSHSFKFQEKLKWSP